MGEICEHHCTNSCTFPGINPCRMAADKSINHQNAFFICWYCKYMYIVNDWFFFTCNSKILLLTFSFSPSSNTNTAKHNSEQNQYTFFCFWRHQHWQGTLEHNSYTTRSLGWDGFMVISPPSHLASVASVIDWWSEHKCSFIKKETQLNHKIWYYTKEVLVVNKPCRLILSSGLSASQIGLNDSDFEG